MGVKLKHASGNGTVIGAPAANPSADITLKAPSTTGSAGQVLAVASANHSSTNAELEWAAAGKILQVVQCIKNDTWYENSVAEGGFSAVVTGLTQAFTCSSTSNKVLITGQIFGHNAIQGGWGVGVALTAGGSIIDASTGNARGSRSRVHAISEHYWLGGSMPINYLHSPSSTSAITYGIKLWNGHTSAQNLSLNYPSSQDGDNNNGVSMVSTLTFMEIAA